MARKADASRDPVAKNIADQLSNFTVGAPQPSTGLIGDQTPETVFDADDFDKIKNQMTLQMQNLDAFEMLNVLSRLSNTSSSSGPIPNTSVIKTSTFTGSTGNKTVFQPDKGQVWQIMAMSMTPSGSGSYRGIVNLKNSDGDFVELVDKSATGTAESLQYDTPLFITNEVFLDFTVVTVDTALALKVAFVRVR